MEIIIAHKKPSDSFRAKKVKRENKRLNKSCRTVEALELVERTILRLEVIVVRF